MAYDRRSSFERRANLHYESVEEDAAYIAGEVIRKGRSPGWAHLPEEQELASKIEIMLAAYNIGLVSTGTWGYRSGGTRIFSSH